MTEGLMCTPKAFRAKNTKTMELLTQQPFLTYKKIGELQNLTTQRVQQINVKLGTYGRPSKHEQIAELENSKKKQEQDLLDKIANSRGTLWPRYSGGGKLVGAVGCPTREQAPTEWAAYANAKQRCNNPKNPMYKWYGGSGILFKFNSFEEFWKEIGAIPWKGLTLDRIENKGHYEKGNIRWTPQKQQCAPGKRRTRKNQ